MFKVERLKYEIRWWRWFFVEDPFTIKWYLGPYVVDKQSRDLMMNRHARAEPTYHGRYIKHCKTCPRCDTKQHHNFDVEFISKR